MIALLVLVSAGCSGSVDVIGGPAVASVIPSAGIAFPEATTPPTVQPVPTAEPSPQAPTVTPAASTPGSGGGLAAQLSVSPAGGLMTVTGVPVEILALAKDIVVVRTPCGATALLSDGDFIEDVQVVLDPGHGGPVDTGAVGPNGLVERDLNLTLSLATQTELESRGASVAVTRTRDYVTLLATRAAFADAIGAEALVSIHHNAPAVIPSSVPGTEIFVQTDSDQSRRLGGLLYGAVFGVLATVDGVAWTTASDAGVVRVLNTRGTDAYGMIRRPVTPTALVELGYIHNASEAAFMATDAYIDIASRALADGIEAYLDTDAPGRGFVDEPRVFDPAFAPGADVYTDPDLE